MKNKVVKKQSNYGKNFDVGSVAPVITPNSKGVVIKIIE